MSDYDSIPTVEDVLGEVRREAYNWAVANLNVSGTEPDTQSRFDIWEEYSYDIEAKMEQRIYESLKRSEFFLDTLRERYFGAVGTLY